jgi:hypothetical protein
LLRLKFYRFVFRRQAAVSKLPSEPSPSTSNTTTIPDLPSIYHTMQMNVAANEERERQIQSTLREISEMMDTS